MIPKTTKAKKRSAYEIWYDKHADDFTDFTSGEIVWKAALASRKKKALKRKGHE